MPTLFSSLPLSPALIEVTRELGFEHLTPIQAASIPTLLKGLDLVGQSKTGSGKTAAFALPILHNISLPLEPRPSFIHALILCPTRELCTQVAREIRKLGRKHSGLQVLILSGGHPSGPQLEALEKGVHIVVGTPGRVLDHLARNTLRLSELKTVVLDEADRMLDMGFQDDIQAILENTPSKRQTIFFSATFPNSIESMSDHYQKNPHHITIVDEESDKPQIHHGYYETSEAGKVETTLDLIRKLKPDSAMIFCNLKTTVRSLTDALKGSNISAECIHGDLEQRDRDRVMAKFRNGSTRILVATDVAARGIDLNQLAWVLNFDLPLDAEVYVHRVGRTGRAGHTGKATSLITSKDRGRLQRIEDFAKIELKKESFELEDGTSDISSLQPAELDAKMKTLYISGGRKDKIRPGDILGALTGEAGRLKGDEIGKIEIHDRFTYVAVNRNVANTAVQRLNIGKIKGRYFKVGLVT